MRKLYEIQADIERLIEINADRYVDGETGEILSKEDFDNLQIEWKDKIEGVILGYKNELAEANAIKAEMEELKARMERHKKRAEGYKAFLTVNLEGKKFETAKAAVSWRQSDVVNVTDITKIPQKYLKFKEPDADKMAIKKALKSGETIEGVVLVEKANIQIK